MRTKELLRKLKGIQTIPSIMSNLNVNKQKAIYYIYRLRKKGYVKTKRQVGKRRIYSISFENKLGGVSYDELINKTSPIQISSANLYKVCGRDIKEEEALIYALKTQSFRGILASLGLFKKIKDWKLLYDLSKKADFLREVGALYEIARKIMRTRKITKSFINRALPIKGERYKYILSPLISKDFKDIQKKWNVYIPFNKKDLEVYKND